MNEIPTDLLAGLYGAILGGIFFGGLWWTVRRSVLSPHAAFWFLGSWLLRTSIVLAGFYLIGDGEWSRLLISLVGFVAARFVVLWLTPSARENPKHPAQGNHHAP